MVLKDDGVIIAITEDDEQLLKWMVTGPEVCRVIQEFQESTANARKVGSNKQHEQAPAFQKVFLKDVKSLLEEFEKSKSPFEVDDLMNIDTRDLPEECVVNTVYTVACLGETKCKGFMKERLIDRTTSISVPIKKNKLVIFSNQNS